MSEEQTNVDQDSTADEVVEEKAPDKETKKVKKEPKATAKKEAPAAKGTEVVGKDDLIAAIKNMTVLELSELVKALEEEFGVSAAAPVAVAGAPAAASVAAPVEEEEKTEFTVVLKDMGANKINVIKAVRELTTLGLREAKELVESAPKPVKENVSKEEAEEAKKKLEAAGAAVEIK